MNAYRFGAQFGIKNALYSWDKLCVKFLREALEVTKWENDNFLWMNIKPLTDLL